jgi:hypothetical protein
VDCLTVAIIDLIFMQKDKAEVSVEALKEVVKRLKAVGA